MSFPTLTRVDLWKVYRALGCYRFLALRRVLQTYSRNLPVQTHGRQRGKLLAGK